LWDRYFAFNGKGEILVSPPLILPPVSFGIQEVTEREERVRKIDRH
jgi:hypothetical protein